MPELEKTVDIAAPPEVVWKIIADTSFVPKLYPHVLAVNPSHSHIAVVGDTVTITAKGIGRKVQASFVATEVVSNQKYSYKHLPDGFLDKYICSISLETSKKGTRVTENVEYEAHAGYLGKLARKAAAHRLVKQNVLQSLDNLKEIAELEEAPPIRKAKV